MGQTHQKVPRVFISSTSEDLKVNRDAAKEAAFQAGMLPVMIEYFTASGDRPPPQKCLDEVDRTEAQCCEVLAFIVDDKQLWPGEHREAYRLTKAMNVGLATPKLFTEVNEHAAQRRANFWE